MSQQTATVWGLGAEVGVCCADSQSVVIFGNGTRTGTEVSIFDTKQSEKTYYFINYVSGTGSGSIVLQVQNQITTSWETVVDFGSFNSVNESIFTETLIQPDNSLSRIQITTTGTWVGSVGTLLVNPKFSE